MSILHLRNPLDSTDLIIPLNFTKIRYPTMSARDLEYPQTSTRNLEYPLTSVKDLKYPLNPKNWSQVLYRPRLSKSLNILYKYTRRTNILL